MRTVTPGAGRPTQTPSPPDAAWISVRLIVETGRHSVIPYGVCATAFGNSSAQAASSDDRTGAPADSSSRTLVKAAR